MSIIDRFNHVFFIHSSIEKILELISILTFVTNAAVNTGAPVSFESTDLISSGYTCQTEPLNPVSSIFDFLSVNLYFYQLCKFFFLYSMSLSFLILLIGMW